ncbi:MAG: 4Fe-4S binding protein [Hadesarchaea archaeon]|nr:4Fe-4S binding protein [Hadesarchaea archaeon]
MDVGENSPGKRVLLMGNEAIARGAIEAGVDVTSAYPGTPASEILETLAEVAPEKDFHAEWSTNEKVAFEVSVGASITGVRSMVSMKNAGLNWVMDPFMTIVYGGIRGGFVIAVADDPNAHYSSNEQDTRIAAAYAEIPCLEPADQQEAKDMTKYAFELSEKLELPVFIRSVTRISHASGDVEYGEINQEKREPVFDRHYKQPHRWNVYGDPGPVEKHRWLKSRQPLAREEVENLPWNELDLPEAVNMGIIAPGLASSYAREALKMLDLENEVAFLKIGTPYPLPKKKIIHLIDEVDKVLVIEEGETMVERRVKEIAQENGFDVKIEGKSTGVIESVGEIDSGIAANAISEVMGINPPELEIDEETREEIEETIAPRSSNLCAGCPHLGTYWALKMALQKSGDGVQIVNGDIGCYEMGGYGIFAKEIKAEETKESKKYPIESPYETIDTNYVMGSGIGLMQGQAQAGYDDGPLVAIAGDSTFFHACLPEVVNAVYNDVDGLFIVMDNRWTAMTGHQPNPCTGEQATGKKSKQLSIKEAARALGVENIYTTDPYNIEESIEVMEKALEQDGFTIVISNHVCTIQALRRDEFESVGMKVNSEECISCKQCVELGCPAITYEDETGGIDWNICVECGMCAQICPTNALTLEEKE